MLNKIKNIITEFFAPPEWKEPDLDFYNYPFFTELIRKKIDYSDFFTYEEKLAILKVGLKAKKQKKTFILHYEYTKQDFNAYMGSKMKFVPTPKLIRCELCPPSTTKGFIYQYEVEYGFTKKI